MAAKRSKIRSRSTALKPMGDKIITATGTAGVNPGVNSGIIRGRVRQWTRLREAGEEIGRAAAPNSVCGAIFSDDRGS